MNQTPPRPSTAETEPLLTCKVCRKLFNHPVLLRCLHSVCARCTKDILEDDQLYCPECHCATSATTHLVPNPYIEEVIRKLDLLSSLCVECGKENAAIWCVQCDSALCANCSETIHSFKTNKSHQRQYVRKMRSSNKPCNIHPAYVYTHYCITCNTPICLSCIIDSHKEHDYMLLENHNLTLVNEISENLKILQECDLNRDRSKEMIASNIERMTPHYEATRDQVRNYFKHLHELLDMKESEIVDEITNQESEETETLQQELVQLKSESFQYKSTIQIIDKLLTSAPSDVAVMCGVIIERLKELPHYDTFVQTDKRGLCSYIWETTIESIINSFAIMNQGVQEDLTPSPPIPPQSTSYTPSIPLTTTTTTTSPGLRTSMTSNIGGGISASLDPYKSMLSSLNSIDIPYTNDPFNGIFHFLGQKPHSNDIINPAYIGECTVTSSSLLYGMLPLLLSPKPSGDTYCVTKDEEGSNWISVGFSKYYVIPTGYTLMCLPNSVYKSPTTWTLEASKTGSNNDWTPLFEHNDDSVFSNSPFYGVWEFDNRNYYSYLRVRTNGQALLLSGIEIFGTLIPKQKAI